MEKNSSNDVLFNNVKETPSLQDVDPKDANSNVVGKVTWKNILDETGIPTSTYPNLQNEAYTSGDRNTVQSIIHECSEGEIGYSEIIDNIPPPVKLLKEWTKDEFEKSCKSVMNGDMSMETAVDQFGIPDWLLKEKIQELSKKSQKKGNKTKGTVRTRKKWSDEAMEQAVFAVSNNKMSLRAAAARFNVPRSSLYDRIMPKKSRKQKNQEPECSSIDGNDIILTDDKAWVIKSLQDGLLSLEEASFRLGLTFEETKAICESLVQADCQVSAIMKEKPVHEHEEMVQDVEETNPPSFQIITESEDGMMLESDTVKPRILGSVPHDDDRSEQSSPNNGTIEFNCVEEHADSRIESGHWSDATMLHVYDARQNNVGSKCLSVVNTLPYTMLSGLHGWVDALDNETLSSASKSKSAKKWTNEAMNQAIHDVKENGLSIRKSAMAHGVPKSSLADRISGRTSANRCKLNCLKKGALKELKLLAKTKEQLEILRHLKNGQISVRLATKELGISYSKMRQYLMKSNEKKATVVKATSDLRNIVSNDHGYEKPADVVVSEKKQKLGEDSVQSKDRKPVGKRGRVRWTREDMEKALAAVKEGRMSIRHAAKSYNIPKSTLGDVVTGKCAIGRSPGPKRLLSDEEENALAGWLMTMYRIGRHVSISEVLDMVKAILDKDGQRVPRLKNNLPKTSWWYGFLGRHKEVALLRKDIMKNSSMKNINDKQDQFTESFSREGEETGKLKENRESGNTNDVQSSLDSNYQIHSESYEIKDPTETTHCSVDGHDYVTQASTVSNQNDYLCGICGQTYADIDCEETWICCGTIGMNDKLINGCGNWFHIKCTGCEQHGFTVEEIKELTWFCQNCTSKAKRKL